MGVVAPHAKWERCARCKPFIKWAQHIHAQISIVHIFGLMDTYDLIGPTYKVDSTCTVEWVPQIISSDNSAL